MIERWVLWLEVLGGVHRPRRRSVGACIAWGVWWVILFVAIFATVGRGTRFIYVDF